MMNQPNPGFLFYKKYSVTPNKFETHLNNAIEATVPAPVHLPLQDTRLINMHFQQGEVGVPVENKIDALQENPVLQQHLSFRMLTTYPGLLAGTGYAHDTRSTGEGDDDSSAGAYKIGFFFDHTTGMPVIPGSSVKGMLRSYFPNQYKKKKVSDDYRKSRYEFIAGLINVVLNDLPLSMFANIQELKEEERKLIDDFESELFDGRYPDERVIKGRPQTIVVSHTIYQRDSFFEAIPLFVSTENINHTKRLFANDYITPHKNRNREKAHLDAFSNPVPLLFLKVAPQIVYEFHFMLRDSRVIPAMKARQKSELFRQILLFSGIGAKTNVGYGQFIQYNGPILKEAAGGRKEILQHSIPDAVSGKLKKDRSFDAVISRVSQTAVFFTFKEGNHEVVFFKKSEKLKLVNPTMGMKVKITMQANYDGSTPNFTVKEI